MAQTMLIYPSHWLGQWYMRGVVEKSAWPIFTPTTPDRDTAIGRQSTCAIQPQEVSRKMVIS